MVAHPVLPGFHPDPSVCRVGDDYYLACSSFEYFPGVPLFHSRDLRNWTRIGNALDRPTQLRLPLDSPSSGGIYAPTLRHHDGRFWLIVTNVSGDGNLLVTATDPAGPWSEPVLLTGVHGIDPDLAWDGDGTCWCTVAGVSQYRIDPRTDETLGPARRIWSGAPGAKAPEAPHLYHIGDFWYLLIAEGGTERGHAVSIARSSAPEGPFEPCPTNPVLTHRGTDEPVQNTGHADLVQARDGSWWMLFLGVRPGGGTPGWHVLGRETFLAPVEWVEGWPVVGELGAAEGEFTSETPHASAPPFPQLDPPHDDFDLADLAPHWISLRDRPTTHCTTKDRPGWLTLRTRGTSLDATDVIFTGRRQQHPHSRTRTLIDPSEGRGGLAVRLDEQHHYSIEATPGEVQVRARIGPLNPIVATHPTPPGPVVLRIETTTPEPRGARTGPDTVTLGIENPDGTYVQLAALDGRYLSTEVAGGFTGRVIGMYAAEGTVHFDWCTYEPVGS
ncbi:glycoside hydrolase family 43 protein [Streptomyces acidiscabies]|uniref:Glycoside hydrolase family 43 protein n=1 Tax=Streptomyces acidiscabies TaxID=42234 RepID=A0AAP6EHV1_9ACTN|nr:glycoside hydrolase family 43 protein [Streptomyces acidiscabies]MBP5941866.1 glycoside hydrolase family 43 protein [Streptomyces sp. LBUM 1476]MBZ3913300.1 glycoside hydrolase family 43 protein [Streptomyces acidiscabies]MDX2963274.1 glycoside hydrolase family 43 protein [Streptomyces acidiscabies]MDX3021508.1 glycoside hydrolase family 43 protein [Streptomyces acidiscabies]MDX3790267.1 glycoside hydrolase family 43 protein [Streptomyces acidiscabies]